MMIRRAIGRLLRWCIAGSYEPLKPGQRLWPSAAEARAATKAQSAATEPDQRTLHRGGPE
jgi:hypothetical protein